MNALGISDEPTAMEGMLKDATKVLDLASSDGVRGIPSALFEDCCGLALLSSVSSSLVIKASVGTGVIVAKNGSSWGLPCACAATGTGWGVGIGVTYEDVLVFFMDESSLVSGNVSVSVGAHAEATLGCGRSAGFTVSRNQGNVVISFSKGASIGASLDGGVIAFRPGVNEKFYEQKGIEASDILKGNGVEVPSSRRPALDKFHSKLEAMVLKAKKEDGPVSDLSDRIGEINK